MNETLLMLDDVEEWQLQLEVMTYVVEHLLHNGHQHYVLMDLRQQQIVSMNRDMMKKKIQNCNDPIFSRERKREIIHRN